MKYTILVKLFNKKGELCATVMNEVYLRNKFPGENQTAAI